MHCSAVELIVRGVVSDGTCNGELLVLWQAGFSSKLRRDEDVALLFFKGCSIHSLPFPFVFFAGRDVGSMRRRCPDRSVSRESSLMERLTRP